MKMFFAILVSCALSLVSYAARAAELYFGVRDREVPLYGQVEVGVFLNTDDEDINAVAGKLIFPEASLKFLEARDGSTIMSLWVERPQLRQGSVVFSGIVPGGFKGQRGYLFSAIFETKKAGEAIADIKDGQALLNDGQGTAAEVREAPLTLTVVEKTEAKGFLAPYDADAPEDFLPEINRDPNIFDGRWFAAFATQDKIAGIDHYEIQERREYSLGRFNFSAQLRRPEWTTAESPYALKDQALRSKIYAKAVDRSGNERLVSVAPLYPLHWYEVYAIWGIITAGAALIFAVSSVIWRRQNKSRKSKSF